MESLVSTQWLERHLGDGDVVPVDCSWHMPATGRVGGEEYLESHIPGARFLDIDEVADIADPAPHMLPDDAAFARAMEQAGISSTDKIICYDNSPHHTAARGWFTFRHFGARNVAILDGGFQKWVAEGRPTEAGEPAPRAAHFDAAGREDVVSKQQLLDGTGLPLLDARGKARFEGSEPEPRPGLASGHIPGAHNLPSAELYDEDGTFRSRAELAALFEAAGIDPATPFVASCGSGVTACSLLFAAKLLGGGEGRLYDGSWSEWGADPAAPKAVGPA